MSKTTTPADKALPRAKEIANELSRLNNALTPLAEQGAALQSQLRTAQDRVQTAAQSRDMAKKHNSDPDILAKAQASLDSEREYLATLERQGQELRDTIAALCADITQRQEERDALATAAGPVALALAEIADLDKALADARTDRDQLATARQDADRQREEAREQNERAEQQAARALDAPAMEVARRAQLTALEALNTADRLAGNLSREIESRTRRLGELAAYRDRLVAGMWRAHAQALTAAVDLAPARRAYVAARLAGEDVIGFKHWLTQQTGDPTPEEVATLQAELRQEIGFSG